MKLQLEQITKLYMVTIGSSLISSILMEIVDFASRRDKCVLSAILYSISMFSLFFGQGGNHFEMLLMGRIVYGVASALQHSSFESYALYQHSSHGFPDDWLSNTFSLLTHSIALMAVLSGVLGQIAATTGPLGCIALCCILFAATAIYLFFMWEKDVHTPRYLLTPFLSNMSKAISTLKSNRQILVLLAISALSETAITIFTFYWAPWISSLVNQEDGSEDQEFIPYEIYFATLIISSMLGNYLYQIYTASTPPSTNSSNSSSNNSSNPSSQIFQAVLLATSVSYFLGAIFQSPVMVFGVSIALQFLVGGYWPSIGYLR